jgi:uncharacterized HAD superfamily protein
MNIAVDIDEVLVELVSPLTKLYNQRFGTNFHLRDYKTYDLEKTWGCSKQEAYDFIQGFLSSSYSDGLSPTYGARESMEILSRHHALIAITARAPNTREHTEKWMEYHFGLSIGEIVFNGALGVLSPYMNKLKVCQEREIPLILEDNLTTANNCAEGEMAVFLFDKPWNQSFNLHPRIKRIAGWPEAVEELI